MSRPLIAALAPALASALASTVALGLGCGGAATPSSPAAPASSTATAGERAASAVGAPAPDAQLTATSGAKVALAELLHQLAQRNIAVIAIAADRVPDMAALQSKLPGITLLTDPQLTAATAWGAHTPG